MSALTALNEEIARCQLCEIAKQRTRTVPGEGAEDADIIFIGEAPGFNEDQQGRPFVGQAGKYLDQLLASISLDRAKVFITNVIKTRPPGNRDPLPVEVTNCRQWLDRQLEIIRPRIIVTLGRHSLERFLPGKTISRAHGTAAPWNGITCFALYHPAAALRQGSLRTVIEADIRKLPGLLEQVLAAPPAPAPAETPPAQQLNMFEV